jgi:hypothetical protein
MGYAQNIALMTQNLGNIANVIRAEKERERAKQLGAAFSQLGDYSPESIQRFMAQTGARMDEMPGIINATGALQQMNRTTEQDAFQRQRHQDLLGIDQQRLGLRRDELDFNKNRTTEQDAFRKQEYQDSLALEQQKLNQKEQPDPIKAMKLVDDAYGVLVAEGNSIEAMDSPQSKVQALESVKRDQDRPLQERMMAAGALDAMYKASGIDPQQARLAQAMQQDNVGLLNTSVIGAPRRPNERQAEQAEKPQKQVTLDNGKTVTAVKAPDGKYYYEENGKYYLVEGE